MDLNKGVQFKPSSHELHGPHGHFLGDHREQKLNMLRVSRQPIPPQPPPNSQYLEPLNIKDEYQINVYDDHPQLLQNINPASLSIKHSLNNLRTSNKLNKSLIIKKEELLQRQQKDEQLKEPKIHKLIINDNNHNKEITINKTTTINNSTPTTPIMQSKKKKKKLKEIQENTIRFNNGNATPWGSLNMTNIFQSQPPQDSQRAKTVLVNIRNVATDVNHIMDRNDKSLRLVMAKSITTIRNLINRGSLKDVLEDIRLIGEIILKSGYFVEIVKLFAKLLAELKNTDETFHFIFEFKRMVGIINKITKAIETESQTLEMFSIEEAQRRKILKSLKNLLNYIIRNKELILIVKNIENLKKQVEIAKEEQRKMFPHETFKEVMKDAPILKEILQGLQSIIGEKINLELLATNIKDLVKYIKSNAYYKSNLLEVSDIVNQIYTMEDLEMNAELEDRIRLLIDQVEEMIIEICALSSMVELRIQLSLLTTSLKRDPLNSKFIDDVKTLFHSMLKKDSKYKIDYKVLLQLKELFIPFLINKIRIIPLPTITNMNDPNRESSTDYKLEDFNIKLTFLDPRCVKVGFITSIQTTPLIFNGTISTLLTIELTNVHLRVDNFKWYLKKHSGFARFKDKGTASLSTGKVGVDLKFKLAFSQNIIKDNRLLENVKTKCKIHDTNIQILKSKHNRLYKKIIRLFEKKIKRALEGAIEGKITEKIVELEQKIYETFFNSDDVSTSTSGSTIPTGLSNSQVTVKDLTPTGHHQGHHRSKSDTHGHHHHHHHHHIPHALRKEKRDKILERIQYEVPNSNELRRARFGARSKTEPEIPGKSSSQPNLPTPDHNGLSSPLRNSSPSVLPSPKFVNPAIAHIRRASFSAPKPPTLLSPLQLPIQLPPSILSPLHQPIQFPSTPPIKPTIIEPPSPLIANSNDSPSLRSSSSGLPIMQPPKLQLNNSYENSDDEELYHSPESKWSSSQSSTSPNTHSSSLSSSSTSSSFNIQLSDKTYDKDFEELDNIFSINRTPQRTPNLPKSVLGEVKELNPKLYNQITNIREDIMHGKTIDLNDLNKYG